MLIKLLKSRIDFFNRNIYIYIYIKPVLLMKKIRVNWRFGSIIFGIILAISLGYAAYTIDNIRLMPSETAPKDRIDRIATRICNCFCIATDTGEGIGVGGMDIPFDGEACLSHNGELCRIQQENGMYRTGELRDCIGPIWTDGQTSQQTIFKLK